MKYLKEDLYSYLLHFADGLQLSPDLDSGMRKILNGDQLYFSNETQQPSLRFWGVISFGRLMGDLQEMVAQDLEVLWFNKGNKT